MGSDPLVDAHDKFYEDLYANGEAECPTCGRKGKIWRTSIVSTAAASLVRLVGMYSGSPIHQDEFYVLAKDRNFARLAKWGLINPARHEDPSKRSSGEWEPTESGILFVDGSHKVQKYLLTFDNEILGFEDPMVSIHDVLGDHFHYQNLLANQGPFVQDSKRKEHT